MVIAFVTFCQVMLKKVIKPWEEVCCLCYQSRREKGIFDELTGPDNSSDCGWSLLCDIYYWLIALFVLKLGWQITMTCWCTGEGWSSHLVQTGANNFTNKIDNDIQRCLYLKRSESWQSLAFKCWVMVPSLFYVRLWNKTCNVLCEIVKAVVMFWRVQCFRGIV